MNDIELTILMPCLNEAETLEICINKASKYMHNAGIKGEVLIADNGSSDGSQEIAVSHSARVINVQRKGYGAALIEGIKAAKGRYVIMGDADDSYDFSDLNNFVEKLRDGYDLVMGNRFRGGIKPHAMPPLHRYLGNPALSFIGRILFPSSIKDFHCGLRGFNKDAILSLNLKTSGMEFASEMVVKSTLHNLKITEIPTTLSPDGRSRPPHLRSWHDGWRHLRFLLLFSPRWLFFYPGIVLLLAGLTTTSILSFGPLSIGAIVLDIHTLLYGSLAISIGMQLIIFAVTARLYGTQIGILPDNKRLAVITNKFKLEHGIIIGATLFLLGVLGSIYAVLSWGETGFGSLDPAKEMRIAIPSIAAIATGLQLTFGSFFISFFKIRTTIEDT
ncbi:glycosyltransferase family 2 protein [Solemya velesiana gill symbiont]|uniref:Dolichol-P-glucose synthetase n=1 Tax=Solemya velesiana gill symbiont TaxID=1918948 RepID=A0A1T2KVV6_9GAMM|nr:glycosyltransferase family 2 protein [Solemya velesiana gill symbiont]OOZ36931.1 dolichol-P-glucose synthetase [Solemya velesiana gill symbiont]